MELSQSKRTSYRERSQEQQFLRCKLTSYEFRPVLISVIDSATVMAGATY